MDIKKGNQDFLNILDNNKELKDRRDELVKGQHPDTLVITCSDSRVVPEYIFNAKLGELFVIRTAGNVINEGELATVEYAIEHLKVKHIIVLGHTHCGAVHARGLSYNHQVLSHTQMLRRLYLHLGHLWPIVIVGHLA